jgi:hypothetical protein
VSVSETIPRIAPTIGGIDPRDLAAEQPVADRLRAMVAEVTKIEYDYTKDGETTITVSGKGNEASIEKKPKTRNELFEEAKAGQRGAVV